jgi:hypothetical protein
MFFKKPKAVTCAVCGKPIDPRAGRFVDRIASRRQSDTFTLAANRPLSRLNHSRRYPFSAARLIPEEPVSAPACRQSFRRRVTGLAEGRGPPSRTHLPRNAPR